MIVLMIYQLLLLQLMQLSFARHKFDDEFQSKSGYSRGVPSKFPLGAKGVTYGHVGVSDEFWDDKPKWDEGYKKHQWYDWEQKESRIPDDTVYPETNEQTDKVTGGSIKPGVVIPGDSDSRILLNPDWTNLLLHDLVIIVQKSNGHSTIIYYTHDRKKIVINSVELSLDNWKRVLGGDDVKVKCNGFPHVFHGSQRISELLLDANPIFGSKGRFTVTRRVVSPNQSPQNGTDFSKDGPPSTMAKSPSWLNLLVPGRYWIALRSKGRSATVIQYNGAKNTITVNGVRMSVADWEKVIAGETVKVTDERTKKQHTVHGSRLLAEITLDKEEVFGRGSRWMVVETDRKDNDMFGTVTTSDFFDTNWLRSFGPNGGIIRNYDNGKRFIVRLRGRNFLINNVLITPEQWREAIQGGSVSLTLDGSTILLAGTGTQEGLTLAGVSILGRSPQLSSLGAAFLQLNGIQRDLCEEGWMKHFTNKMGLELPRRNGNTMRLKGSKDGNSVRLDGVKITEKEWIGACNGQKVTVSQKGQTYEMTSDGLFTTLTWNGTFFMNSDSYITFTTALYLPDIGQVDMFEYKWFAYISEEYILSLRNDYGIYTVLRRSGEYLLVNNVKVTADQWARAMEYEVVTVQGRAGQQHVLLSADGSLQGIKFDDQPIFSRVSLGNIRMISTKPLNFPGGGSFNLYKPGWMKQLTADMTLTNGNMMIGSVAGDRIQINNVEILESDWLNALNGERVQFTFKGTDYILESTGYVPELKLNGVKLFWTLDSWTFAYLPPPTPGDEINFFRLHWIQALRPEQVLIVRNGDGRRFVIRNEGGNILCNNILITPQQWNAALRGERVQLNFDGRTIILTGDGTLAGFRIDNIRVIGELPRVIEPEYLQLLDNRIDIARRGWMRLLHPDYLYIVESNGHKYIIKVLGERTVVTVNGVEITEVDWLRAMNGETVTVTYKGKEYVLKSDGTLSTFSLNDLIIFKQPYTITVQLVARHINRLGRFDFSGADWFGKLLENIHLIVRNSDVVHVFRMEKGNMFINNIKITADQYQTAFQGGVVNLDNSHILSGDGTPRGFQLDRVPIFGASLEIQLLEIQNFEMGGEWFSFYREGWIKLFRKKEIDEIDFYRLDGTISSVIVNDLGDRLTFNNIEILETQWLRALYGEVVEFTYEGVKHVLRSQGTLQSLVIDNKIIIGEFNNIRPKKIPKPEIGGEINCMIKNWIIALREQEVLVIRNDLGNVFVVRNRNNNILINNILITSEQWHSAIKGGSVEIQYEGRTIILRGNGSMQGLTLDNIVIFGSLSPRRIREVPTIRIYGKILDLSKEGWMKHLDPAYVIVNQVNQQLIRGTKEGTSIFVTGVEITEANWLAAINGAVVKFHYKGKDYILRSEGTFPTISINGNLIFGSNQLIISKIIITVQDIGDIDFSLPDWIMKIPERTHLISWINGKAFVLKRNGVDILINNIRITQDQWRRAMQCESVNIVYNGETLILIGDGSMDGLRLAGLQLFENVVNLQVYPLQDIRISNNITINVFNESWMRILRPSMEIRIQKSWKLSKIIGSEKDDRIFFDGVEILEYNWLKALNGDRVTFLATGGTHVLESYGTLESLKLNGVLVVGHSRWELHYKTEPEKGDEINFWVLNWIKLIPGGQMLIIRNGDGHISVVKNQDNNILINNIIITPEQWLSALQGNTVVIVVGERKIILKGDGTTDGFTIDNIKILENCKLTPQFVQYLYIEGHGRYDVSEPGWMKKLDPSWILNVMADKNEIIIRVKPGGGSLIVDGIEISEADWISAMNGQVVTFTYKDITYTLKSEGTLSTLTLNGKFLFGDRYYIKLSTTTIRSPELGLVLDLNTLDWIKQMTENLHLISSEGDMLFVIRRKEDDILINNIRVTSQQWLTAFRGKSVEITSESGTYVLAGNGLKDGIKWNGVPLLLHPTFHKFIDSLTLPTTNQRLTMYLENWMKIIKSHMVIIVNNRLELTGTADGNSILVGQVQVSEKNWLSALYGQKVEFNFAGKMYVLDSRGTLETLALNGIPILGIRPDLRFYTITELKPGDEINFYILYWIRALRPQRDVCIIRNENGVVYVIRNVNDIILINNIPITPHQWQMALKGETVEIRYNGKTIILKGDGSGTTSGITLDGVYIFGKYTIERPNSDQYLTHLGRHIYVSQVGWMKLLNPEFVIVVKNTNGKDFSIKVTEGGRGITINRIEISEDHWIRAMNGEIITFSYQGNTHVLKSEGTMETLTLDNVVIFGPSCTFKDYKTTIIFDGHTLDLTSPTWITRIRENFHIISSANGKVFVLRRKGNDIVINNVRLTGDQWSAAIQGETLKVNGGNVVFVGDGTLEGFKMNEQLVFGPDLTHGTLTGYLLQPITNGHVVLNIYDEGWMRNFKPNMMITVDRRSPVISGHPSGDRIRYENYEILETDWLRALAGETVQFNFSGKKYILESRGTLETLALNGILIFGSNPLYLSIMEEVKPGGPLNIYVLNWIKFLPPYWTLRIRNDNGQVFIIRNQDNNILINNILITPQQWQAALWGHQTIVLEINGRKVILKGDGTITGLTLDNIPIFGEVKPEVVKPIQIVPPQPGSDIVINVYDPDWMSNLDDRFSILIIKGAGKPIKIKVVDNGIVINGVTINQDQWNKLINGETITVIVGGISYEIKTEGSFDTLIINGVLVFGKDYTVKWTQTTVQLEKGFKLDFTSMYWIGLLSENVHLISRTKTNDVFVIRRQNDDILINNILVTMANWQKAIEGGTAVFESQGQTIKLSGDGTVEGLRLNGVLVFGPGLPVTLYYLPILKSEENKIAINVFSRGWMQLLTIDIEIEIDMGNSGSKIILGTETGDRVHTMDVDILEKDWLVALYGQKVEFTFGGKKYVLESFGTLDTLKLNNVPVFGDYKSLKLIVYTTVPENRIDFESKNWIRSVYYEFPLIIRNGQKKVFVVRNVENNILMNNVLITPDQWMQALKGGRVELSKGREVVILQGDGSLQGLTLNGVKIFVNYKHNSPLPKHLNIHGNNVDVCHDGWMRKLDPEYRYIIKSGNNEFSLKVMDGGKGIEVNGIRISQQEWMAAVFGDVVGLSSKGGTVVLTSEGEMDTITLGGVLIFGNDFKITFVKDAPAGVITEIGTINFFSQDWIRIIRSQMIFTIRTGRNVFIIRQKNGEILINDIRMTPGQWVTAIQGGRVSLLSGVEAWGDNTLYGFKLNGIPVFSSESQYTVNMIRFEDQLLMEGWMSTLKSNEGLEIRRRNPRGITNIQGTVYGDRVVLNDEVTITEQEWFSAINGRIVQIRISGKVYELRSEGSLETLRLNDLYLFGAVGWRMRKKKTKDITTEQGSGDFTQKFWIKTLAPISILIIRNKFGKEFVIRNRNNDIIVNGIIITSEQWHEAIQGGTVEVTALSGRKAILSGDKSRGEFKLDGQLVFSFDEKVQAEKHWPDTIPYTDSSGTQLRLNLLSPNWMQLLTPGVDLEVKSSETGEKFVFKGTHTRSSVMVNDIEITLELWMRAIYGEEVTFKYQEGRHTLKSRGLLSTIMLDNRIIFGSDPLLSLSQVNGVFIVEGGIELNFFSSYWITNIKHKWVVKIRNPTTGKTLVVRRKGDDILLNNNKITSADWLLAIKGEKNVSVGQSSLTGDNTMQGLNYNGQQVFGEKVGIEISKPTEISYTDKSIDVFMEGWMATLGTNIELLFSAPNGEQTSIKGTSSGDSALVNGIQIKESDFIAALNGASVTFTSQGRQHSLESEGSLESMKLDGRRLTTDDLDAVQVKVTNGQRRSGRLNRHSKRKVV